MILNKKVRTLFALALYIGFTIAIYAIVCHFIHREFQDIHLLYAILIGVWLICHDLLPTGRRNELFYRPSQYRVYHVRRNFCQWPHHKIALRH